MQEPAVGLTVHIYNRRPDRVVEGPQTASITAVRANGAVEVAGANLDFIPKSTRPPRVTAFGTIADVNDLGIPPSNGEGNEDRKWWWEWPA